MRQPWPAPQARGPVDAVVTLPGSKSLTNRYLVLAALAADVSRLRRPLRSRDTLLMAEGLRRLGGRVLEAPGEPGHGPDWIVEPGLVTGSCTVDCGLAGTVMRFLPPLAALARGPVTFRGDPVAGRRPMGPGIGALRALGVAVDDAGRGRVPFTVLGTGSVSGGLVRIDASSSSQFVSGLLLSAARFDNGLEVVHEGPPVPSRPHIQMTTEVLRDAGVVVDDDEPNRWRVEPSEVFGLDVLVEPDLSNAAAFLAAAMVTGGTVYVPGWPAHTTQAGDAIRDIFDTMGGSVSLAREGITVTGPTTVHGLDIDLSHAGELAPVVAAVAAVADGPSWLRGIGHLRGHETDRLAALGTEIEARGGRVEVLADGLHIRPRPLRGGVFHTYADHRMAMAGAILGLVVPGMRVEDVGTTGKTLPDFVTRWQAMVGALTPEAPAGSRAGSR
ncbi:MAG TPA: 3-phosphoshikimate 1-carboxyvinyltransferase [Dermatophilaceae bacterium]|nr:3-phosphoshikimate 1-carboxyvinyltransferase [Dermatophilaceae bacterium]